MEQPVPVVEPTPPKETLPTPRRKWPWIVLAVIIAIALSVWLAIRQQPANSQSPNVTSNLPQANTSQASNTASPAANTPLTTTPATPAAPPVMRKVSFSMSNGTDPVELRLPETWQADKPVQEQTSNSVTYKLAGAAMATLTLADTPAGFGNDKKGLTSTSKVVNEYTALNWSEDGNAVVAFVNPEAIAPTFRLTFGPAVTTSLANSITNTVKLWYTITSDWQALDTTSWKTRQGTDLNITFSTPTTSDPCTPRAGVGGGTIFSCGVYRVGEQFTDTLFIYQSGTPLVTNFPDRIYVVKRQGDRLVLQAISDPNYPTDLKTSYRNSGHLYLVDAQIQDPTLSNPVEGNRYFGLTTKLDQASEQEKIFRTILSTVRFR